jgi:hypothetical protein
VWPREVARQGGVKVGVPPQPWAASERSVGQEGRLLNRDRRRQAARLRQVDEDEVWWGGERQHEGDKR